MAMNFENLTTFPSLNFDAAGAGDREFHVVVARVTYDIAADGNLLEADTQAPPAMQDEFYPGSKDVRQESDLAPFKPRCDVVVLGEAVAPGPKAFPRFETGIRIARGDQTLL